MTQIILPDLCSEEIDRAAKKGKEDRLENKGGGGGKGGREGDGDRSDRGKGR